MDLEILNKKVEHQNYGRSLTASIHFGECHITGEKTYCVLSDGSDGEYMGVSISIEYLYNKLKEMKQL